jgi:hypothetical protein
LRATLLALALAAGMLAMVVVLRGGVDLREHPEKGQVSVKATKRLPADAVLAIVPGAPFPALQAGVAAPARRMTPAVEDLDRRRNYSALYERLKDKADRNGEESYVLAEVLRACARIAGRKPSGSRSFDRPDAREQFMAALPEKDPFRAHRIRAYEHWEREPCAGFPEVDLADAQLRALLAAAATAGDPKARARLLQEELGKPCGEDAPDLVRACATRGQCATNNYREYLFYYQVPPHAAQLVNEYYTQLGRATRSGDWSYFAFHRGPAPQFATIAPAK